MLKEHKPWWIERRAWLSLALFAVVVVAYVGTYLIFAKHSVLLQSMCSVEYPGAIRMYAFDSHSAEVLGHTAVEIVPGSAEAQRMELLSDSIYVRKAWHAGFWKIFHPLERAEHAWRGLETRQVNYAVAEIKSPSPAATPNGAITASVPHNCVCREVYVRNGQLCWIVSDEKTKPVPGTKVLSYTAEAWLLRWNLAGVADGATVKAASVTRLDVRNKSDWATHVETAWPLFLSLEGQDELGHKLFKYDEHVSVFQASEDGSAAREVKRGDGFQPPKWCAISGIPVDPSGAFFISMNNGLRVFRSDTLESVRELKETPGMAQFGAARSDELDSRHSSCFLFYEAGLFVRIANIYRSNVDPCDYEVAVVYDFVHDTVRDIELRIGDRTDVRRVEWGEGKLWFYAITVKVSEDKSKAEWNHVVMDERQEKVYRVPTDSSASPLLWNRERGWLIRGGWSGGSPRPLPVETEMQVFNYLRGTSCTFRIDFRDAEGMLGLFGEAGK